MITIQDGNYHYTEETGVHDIQLQIQKGETVGLMGPNGAGKSTLIKVLTGVYEKDDGQIFVLAGSKGRLMTHHADRALRGHLIQQGQPLG